MERAHGGRHCNANTAGSENLMKYVVTSMCLKYLNKPQKLKRSLKQVKSSIFNYFNSLRRFFQFLRELRKAAGEMAFFSQWSIGSF